LGALWGHFTKVLHNLGIELPMDNRLVWWNRG
jgi:hypothetical protein